MGKITPKKLVIPISLLLTTILTWWSYSAALSGMEAEVERLQGDIRQLKGEAKKVVHAVRRPGESTYAGISVPLFPTDNSGSYIKFPEGVTRLWIDVGAHRESMMCRPALETQKDLAVLAIEPLYDNWGELTIKNHHARLFTVPAAISPNEGFAKFRRAGTDMCSSLKDVNGDAIRKDWPGGCTETAFTYLVPTLRLDTLIRMVPNNIKIEFLKVDAQGSDLDVIQSAGEELVRVGCAVVELQLQRPLYKGSAKEGDFKTLFQQSGFKHEITKIQNLEKTEANMFFINPKMNQPRDGVLPLDQILRDVVPVDE